MIYTVTHKNYNQIEDDFHKTIFVGKNKSEATKIRNLYFDDTLDNISYKNENFCELTAIYWLWKNIKTDNIIGIQHYRRMFSSIETDNSYIGEEEIKSILKKFDFIVVPKVYRSQNIVTDYKKNHIAKDWDILHNSILDLYPEYRDALLQVESRHYYHSLNMFITSKKNYDQYCEWLFSILFYVEQFVNLDDKDTYQKRVFGFMSERLLDVWLIKNSKTIYEQNVISYEEMSKPKKILKKTKQNFLKKLYFFET